VGFVLIAQEKEGIHMSFNAIVLYLGLNFVYPKLGYKKLNK